MGQCGGARQVRGDAVGILMNNLGLIDNSKAPSKFTIFGTGTDLTQALIYD